MAKIKVLGTALINQIAAGEVIERPASIIKELVENSLDAKASKISIILRQGGKSHIQIIDDGIGMDEEDMVLAFERHATSKISTQDDLQCIQTMGFRGEALPAIAAIAKIVIKSKQEYEIHGHSLSIEEAGKNKNMIPIAMAQGTSIEVREIFYATPARLKFLKSDTTEKIACLEVVEKLAIANPSITFTIYDGEKKIRTYQGGSPTERYYQVLGKEFMDNSIPMHGMYEDITWDGYISIPTYHQRTNHEQYYILNGRVIKDKLLLGIMKIPYAGLLPQGRHPAGILKLSMPAHDVDVNVHPAKTEVRFKKPQNIRGSLLHSVGNALQAMPIKTSLNSSAISMQPERKMPYHLFAYPHQHLGEKERSLGSWMPMAKNDNASAESHQEKEYTQEEWQQYPLGAAKTQLQKNWIITQTHEGMVIVDQHAAHERLMHDKIAEERRQGGVKQQLLLIPEVIAISMKKQLILMQSKDIMETFGIQWDNFGQGSIIVRTIPSVLEQESTKTIMADIIAALREGDEPSIMEEKLHEKIARKACHGSIRAGRELSLLEMNGLLRAMEENPKSGQCSHGRPTFIKISWEELEKLFKRR